MRIMLRTKGMTLMELIVVIAIITALAAIIFPVYFKSREKAKQSTCLSNLRQLGMASLMYAQDHDGFFPPYINRLDFTDTHPLGEGYCRADLLYSALKSYVGDSKVWFCPSDSYAGRAIEYHGVFHEYTSYKYCFKITLSVTVDGWYVHGELHNSAAETPIIGDPLWLKDENNHGFTGPHFGKCNDVYADGHAELFKY